MKRAFTATVCSVAIMLALPGSLCAENYFDDVTVTPDPVEAGNNVNHGYVEYRFRVTNRSVSTPHDVELVMPNRSYSSGAAIRRITREVTIAPGTTVIVSLFQLPLQLTGDSLVSVLVDGRRKGTVALSAFAHGYGYASSEQAPRILLSRSVAASDFERNIASNYFENVTNITTAAEAAMSFTMHGGRAPRPATPRTPSLGELATPVRSDLEPAEWKENWLAYSSFDGVVMNESDIKQMPQNTKLALLRYVECGGSLLVGGTLDIPRPWNKYQMQLSGDLKCYKIGFGQCIMSPTTPLKDLNKPQIQGIRQMWLKSRQPWQTTRDQTQASEMFPVVDKITLPLRAIFILMICFTVVIGLDLFILYRIKRQIWMIWTIPVLSGITAALVVVYAFISEGITPTLRIEGLTVLDQVQHRATTLGTLGYYCPITPSEGLHFGYDSELTPFIGTEWHSRQNTPSKTIDFSRDQHLESGWVSARAPSIFSIRKSEQRRERLGIKRIDAFTISVVNGLGVDIDKLWVTDEMGKVFSSGITIPAGKEVALSPSAINYRTSDQVDRLGQVYGGQEWYVAAACPSNDPSPFLIPGTYVALLNSAPFIEKGLIGRSHEKLKSVVVGFWAEE